MPSWTKYTNFIFVTKTHKKIIVVRNCRISTQFRTQSTFLISIFQDRDDVAIMSLLMEPYGNVYVTQY